MDTTEPDVTANDSQPINAYRAERLAHWLIEGRGQIVLAAREHALRRFRQAYGKPPSKKQWSRAYVLAGRMA